MLDALGFSLGVYGGDYRSGRSEYQSGSRTGESGRQESGSGTDAAAQAGGIAANGETASSIPVDTVPAVFPAEQGKIDKDGKDGKGRFDHYECQTCKNRKYQDGSNDPGVSFKTPTSVSPEKATAAVRSHENEHVTREQAKAKREGRKVVSQSVTYQSAVCPECGKVYTAGGTTRTVTKKQVDQTYGMENEEKGKYVDMTA